MLSLTDLRRNGIQIVMAHMDEKWFWSIAACRNLKCIPFLGAEPAQRGVQHESHLEKVMGIASTAFALEGNDIAKGGLAFLINLVRTEQGARRPQLETRASGSAVLPVGRTTIT
jgi:hypothetical protein